MPSLLDSFDADTPALSTADPKKDDGPGLTGRAKDLAISLLKGAIDVPEAAVGLADLVTGGRAGKAAEAAGYRPAAARGILDEWYSPQQRDAFKRVQQADGIVDTLKEAVSNPSVIAQSVAESLPSMGAGGVVGRGTVAAVGRLAPTLASEAAATLPVVGGAVGEGTVQAGQAAEQIRHDNPDGLLTGTQAQLAVASGVFDTAIAMIGGRVAQRFGLNDIDTMLAGAKATPKFGRSVVREVLEGAASEGILEELPQSIQEQVLQNIAQDKPLDDGVNQAAVLGMLSGAVMGGGANAVHSHAAAPTAAIAPAATAPIEQPAPPLEPAPAVAAAPVADAPPAGPLSRAAASVAPHTDPAALIAGTLGQDPVQVALQQKADEEKTAQNLSNWMQRAEPMPLDKAQNLKARAADELGHPMEVVPHSDGYGYTLVPSQWVAPTLRNQVPQGEDQGFIAHDTAPTGVLRADTQGNVTPETHDQALTSLQAAAEIAAAKQRKAEIGLTPDVEAAAARIPRMPQPVPDIVNKNGEPFKNKGAAVRAQKAAARGVVTQVDGGWVVRQEVANVGAIDTAGSRVDAAGGGGSAVGTGSQPDAAVHGDDSRGAVARVPQKPAAGGAANEPVSNAGGELAAAVTLDGEKGAGSVAQDLEKLNALNRGYKAPAEMVKALREMKIEPTATDKETAWLEENEHGSVSVRFDPVTNAAHVTTEWQGKDINTTAVDGAAALKEAVEKGRKAVSAAMTKRRQMIDARKRTKVAGQPAPVAIENQPEGATNAAEQNAEQAGRGPEHQDRAASGQAAAAGNGDRAQDAAPGNAEAPARRGAGSRRHPVTKDDTPFKRGEVSDAARQVGVQQFVDEVTDRWSNAPDVVVAKNMDDKLVPDAVRAAANLQKKQGSKGEPQGFVHAGKVYILSDTLGSADEALTVLAHEALGHFGLRGMFGDRLDPIKKQILAMRPAEVAAKARAYGLVPESVAADAKPRDVLRAMAPEERLYAAEEVLAEMAQNVPTLGFVKRAVAAIRTWLRENVPSLFKNSELTDDEIIRNFIIPARGWVVRGRESGVREAGSTAFSLKEDDVPRKAALLQGEPVMDLPTQQAPRGFAAIRKWATGLFTAAGGQAVNPELGAVALNHHAVRDSMGHGMNPFKAEAFAAVPTVIEKGVVVHSGRKGDQDSFWISAPVRIQGKDDIVTALVRRDANTQRMYLHSVATKEYLLNPRVSRAPTKVGELTGSSDSADVESVLRDLLNFKLDNKASRAPATGTEAFKKWFGDSKVVDDKGQPMVVYHGTSDKFTTFNMKKATQGVAWFTSDRAAVETGDVGAQGRGQIMDLYASIQNPAGWSEYDKLTLDELQQRGYDGVLLPDGDGSVTGFVFEPTQLKSASGNKGTFDPKQGNIMFSRGAAADVMGERTVREQVLQGLNDTLNAPGKVNWWHKTVGTMYNLAQRSPEFKRVFDSTQDFIHDVSRYATEAADLAPRILPKLETWRDITKSPISAKDNKAIAAPIFEGTLLWTRDAAGKPVKVEDLRKQSAALGADEKARRMLRSDRISEGVLKMWQGLPIEQYQASIDTRYENQMLRAGIVWTDKELKDLHGLNDDQAGLYKEFRNTVDQSIQNLAISDMLRFAGKDAEAVRQDVLTSGDAVTASMRLRDHLLELAAKDPKRNDALIDTADRIVDKGDRARDLIERGYAPLSRFGHYTVDVISPEGERLYFSMFETASEAAQMARKMVEAYPEAKITRGTVSEEEYKLFAGVSPETVELFGQLLGLESQGGDAPSQAFQTYIKVAKANRSAMKRLIERKGIAGFSEDAGRVLAGFVYSNARQTSQNLHMGEMTQAAADVSKGAGELKDQATRLVDYVRNPQQEAQGLRGLLFAQYLGGSVASALVNMLQPAQVTFPYLSQYGGAAKAATTMAKAFHDAAKRQTGDAKLDAALKLAEEEGIVAPQEVHQLMAQASGRGVLKSGDGTTLGDARAKASNAFNRLAVGWGKLFGAAEQFNRRVTFIAAYRTAVDQGIAQPEKFAEKAIAETQFVYNKGNKPEWARGAIGSTLFTFKQYSISYIELLHRMATQNGPEGKKAALLAMGVLFLLSGAGGLPFADDADDLVDGVMQRLGYNFSSKMAKKEFFAKLLGKDLGRFAERGLSGLPGAPIDVAGRLGLGNLIPGTGLLTKKDDYTKDVTEFAGAAGDFATRAFKGTNLALQGDLFNAHEQISPRAASNAAKAWEMYTTGAYKDQSGKRVIDVDAFDAMSKLLGFQPTDVAAEQERTGLVQNMKAQNQMMEKQVADKWARAVAEHDDAALAAARAEMKDWNEKNPGTPIRINRSQINKRVQELRMSKEQRVMKSTPKELRATVRRELEPA